MEMESIKGTVNVNVQSTIVQVEVKTLREQLTGVREELAREKVRTGSLQEHHPSPQTETEGIHV